MKDSNCVFCKIVAGEIPCYKIWEDEKHLSFLSLWPNTEGFSVVITKDHNPSYVFDLEEETMFGLISAARIVAKLIDSKFDDVGRTGLVFEGFGVDHSHAKLFPMHGTKTDAWKQNKTENKKFFEKYEGFISSHDSVEMPKEKLLEIQKRLTS